MKYEVAIKGRFRKKRVVLGTIEAKNDDIHNALTMLGWQYIDDRLPGSLFQKGDSFVFDKDISVKLIKEA